MKRHGEGELQAVNQESMIHKGRRKRRGSRV
jgi:hypothetical protein